MIFKEIKKYKNIVTNILNLGNNIPDIIDNLQKYSKEEQSLILSKLELSEATKVNIKTQLLEASAKTANIVATEMQEETEEDLLLAQWLSIGADEAEVISTNAVTTAQGTQIGVIDVLKMKYQELAVSIGISTTALTAFIAVAAGVAIAAVVIENVHVSAEETKEAVSELMNEFNSALKTAKANEKTVESLADRYKELSQGVNNLGKTFLLLMKTLTNSVDTLMIMQTFKYPLCFLCFLYLYIFIKIYFPSSILPTNKGFFRYQYILI